MKLFKNNKTNRLTLTLVMLISLFSNQANAWDREEAEKFVVLPKAATNPEAITADADGNIFVTTFYSGEIHSYTANGNLIRSIKLQTSSGILTDLAFHPDTGSLLVADFGAKKILNVNPFTGESTVFSQIPGEKAGPNVLTFDNEGNVYVSDSFQATIWKIPAEGGEAIAWLKDDLLSTTHFPTFGANGIAFNNDKTVLYIANTGEGTVLKVLIDENHKATSTIKLVNGLNGPDGLIVDNNNNILVAESFSNQIVKLNPEGNTVDVYGDFEGISKQGIVKGLLFPSDLVLVNEKLFVTNFAVDVTSFGFKQTGTNIYSKQVKRHSIAQIETDE